MTKRIEEMWELACSGKITFEEYKLAYIESTQ